MKTRIAAIALGALVAAPIFLPSAGAQRLDPARERAIRECMALQKQDSHDPYDKQAGVQHHYRACMASRGQPE